MLVKYGQGLVIFLRNNLIYSTWSTAGYLRKPGTFWRLLVSWDWCSQGQLFLSEAELGTQDLGWISQEYVIFQVLSCFHNERPEDLGSSFISLDTNIWRLENLKSLWSFIFFIKKKKRGWTRLYLGSFIIFKWYDLKKHTFIFVLNCFHEKFKKF